MKRIALVAGASGGIGREIVRILLGLGFCVIAHGRSRERLLQQFAAEKDKDLSVVAGNLVSPGGRRSVVEQIYAMHNTVDVLVNCAGGAGEHQSWWDTGEEKWEAVFQLNVMGTASLCASFSKGMIERRWGRIINIASVAAWHPLDVGPEYAAAKAAVRALSVSLAKACGPYGVTVNSISPGLVLTETVKQTLDRLSPHRLISDAEYHQYAAEHVFRCLTGRLTEPKSIAETVAFLLSDAASNITAQDIVLDGGYLVI